jgi:hypothetical protein
VSDTVRRESPKGTGIRNAEPRIVCQGAEKGGVNQSHGAGVKEDDANQRANSAHVFWWLRDVPSSSSDR